MEQAATASWCKLERYVKEKRSRGDTRVKRDLIGEGKDAETRLILLMKNWHIAQTRKEESSWIPLKRKLLKSDFSSDILEWHNNQICL